MTKQLTQTEFDKKKAKRAEIDKEIDSLMIQCRWEIEEIRTHLDQMKKGDLRSDQTKKIVVEYEKKRRAIDKRLKELERHWIDEQGSWGDPRDGGKLTLFSYQ